MANLSQHAGGGNIIVAGTTEYNGVDEAVQWADIGDSGNLITAVCGFEGVATSTDTRVLLYARDTTYIRLLLAIVESDNALGSANKIWFRVYDNTNTTVCSLFSSTVVTDGLPHSILCAYDGDNGTARLFVDGVDDDDTGNAQRVAPTTATLNGLSQFTIGTNSTDGTTLGALGTSGIAGNLYSCGYHDQYITDPSLFFNGAAGKEIDEAGWAEWGSQPLIWCFQGGGLTDHPGSAGTADFTKVTTVDLDPVPATLGIDTIGDATANDVTPGKLAWVNGVSITGVGPDYWDGIEAFWDFTGGSLVDAVNGYTLSGSGTWSAQTGLASDDYISTGSSSTSAYLSTSIPLFQGGASQPFTILMAIKNIDGDQNSGVFEISNPSDFGAFLLRTQATFDVWNLNGEDAANASGGGTWITQIGVRTSNAYGYVAVTWDGSTTATHYQDGYYASATITSMGDTMVANAEFRIGCHRDSPATWAQRHWYNRVAIFNRVLPYDEIMWHQNGFRGRSYLE